MRLSSNTERRHERLLSNHSICNSINDLPALATLKRDFWGSKKLGWDLWWLLHGCEHNPRRKLYKSYLQFTLLTWQLLRRWCLLLLLATLRDVIGWWWQRSSLTGEWNGWSICLPHIKVQEWTVHSWPWCNRDGRLSFLTWSGYFIPAWLWATILPYGARLRQGLHISTEGVLTLNLGTETYQSHIILFLRPQNDW